MVVRRWTNVHCGGFMVNQRMDRFGRIVLLIIGLMVVVVQGKLISKELTSDTCPPPNLALNISTPPHRSHHNRNNGGATRPRYMLARGEHASVRIRNEYKHVREVKFLGSIGPLGEQRMCKIKCIGGQWVGPLCVNQQDNGRFHPLFRSCKLEHINSHLLVTFRNVTIHSPGWVFPHGAKLQIRCRELGLYKLLGMAIPQCLNGVWSNKLPSCVPTTLLNNFTEDAPPTILIRIPSGSAAVEPNGDLAMYPGSTLHLECLFSRRLGAPDWTWTASLGQYLTGWAIASEERDWKYRLSVYYAKSQDTGTFTCATPRGLTNSVNLIVAAVHCEAISVTGQYISVRVEGTRLGHKASFQCPLGFNLNGTENLTCQASGKWSDPVPSCQPVVCPSLENSLRFLDRPHLQIDEHNNTYGGRVVFMCSWGYRLLGQPSIECELNGTWSRPPPKCIPIQCPPPIIPHHTYLIQSESAGMDGGRYAVGSLVQFTCRDAHQLTGEASIICTETGYWSHPLPYCKPRCPYLGEPNNGVVAPTKFAYEPGDELQVICDPGYEAKLEPRPQCLSNGEWSIPDLPHCTNYSMI